MRIVIGSDRVGLELKKTIIEYLCQKGYEVNDVGTNSAEGSDYPTYGRAAAMEIIDGRADLGILICGTGVGISIAANKIKGIRAVVCSEPYTAKLSRQHNDSNVLAFGARVVGVGLAKEIVDAWLEASFEGGRHRARVELIEGEV